MWITLGGLILDIAGVIMIFVMRDKPFPTIVMPPIRAYTNKTQIADPTIAVRRKIEDLVTDTNTAIESVNESNRKRYKISAIGLALIIVGFLLQMLGTSWSFLFPTDV